MRLFAFEIIKNSGRLGNPLLPNVVRSDAEGLIAPLVAGLSLKLLFDPRTKQLRIRMIRIRIERVRELLQRLSEFTFLLFKTRFGNQAICADGRF